MTATRPGSDPTRPSQPATSKIPLQVRHIIGRLEQDYRALIDLSDVHQQAEAQQEQVFRTRALTALTIQHLTGCTADEAAKGVVDGFNDNGIDGVAVQASGPQVWIIQTKWSDTGRASLDQASALKLKRGVGKVQDAEWDDFGPRFSNVAEELDRAIATPGVSINIVAALLGEPRLAPLVEADMQSIVDQLNVLEPLARLHVKGFSDFHAIVRAGVSESGVDLRADLSNWGHLVEPFKAFYGSMAVADVAEWYKTYGERLFAKNIRRSLGLTEVNHKLRTTLKEYPERFWYFNNGITLLCDELKKSQRGANRDVGDFSLTDASVVNGAQTVRAIHDAMDSHPDEVSQGRVWVRFISLEECPEGFASQVTEATNTQNQVEARDFVALDPVQTGLRDDFVLSLGKTYVLKRGEPDPEPSSGCSVVDAARALACFNSDASYSARAKQDSSVLWESGERGTYTALFGGPPNAISVWRLVLTLRSVQSRLETEQAHRDGRATRIADQADLLVTHIIHRLTDSQPIDDPATDWESVIIDQTGKVPLVLDWVIHYVDSLFGAASFVPATFRDPQRCIDLSAAVVASIQAGGPVPDLPTTYRASDKDARRRRRNAVAVLVDSGAIKDGTNLTFKTSSPVELAVLEPWFNEDYRRRHATWVNNRATPLLWEQDGLRYSPSGLVKQMLRLAGKDIKAVQGTSRWHVGAEGSLVDIANAHRSEVDEEEAD